LPVEINRYIHRVGRTARAGNFGVSITIADENELYL
jgi:superfamily II DNA/RNA helicase